MKHSGRSRDLESQLFILGLILPFLIIPAYWFYREILQPLSPFPYCIWDRVFGFYCPGCGGTRAMEALAQGRLLDSVRYHPVVGYGVLLYFIFMLSHLAQKMTKGRVSGIRFRSGYLYGALALIVANCLIRNFLRFRYGVYI